MRLAVVLEAYQHWTAENAGLESELFLRDCYKRNTGRPAPWQHAIEFLHVKLAQPLPADRRAHRNLRYGQRIDMPTHCQTHTKFWQHVLAEFDLHGVVTTNYDILIERSLRHRPMKRPQSPGCHYAGIGPVVAHGSAQPWTVTRPDREVMLSGRVPLYKLHGSLNWALQANVLRNGANRLHVDLDEGVSAFKVFVDLRLALRAGGQGAIVPPLPEKDAPSWAKRIWNEAHDRLADAEVWVVVGYSLPDYDIALRDMFTSAAQHRLRHVRVYDPSPAIYTKWEHVTGQRVEQRPGLTPCQ